MNNQLFGFEEAAQEYRESRLMPRLFYLIFMLPFVLFALGWYKPIFSVPILIIAGISAYFAWRHASSLWVPVLNKNNIIRIVIISILIFLWVFISGIGGAVYQNMDHYFRNAIFEDLINRPWPVVDLPTDSMLVYYIAFWLPAAFFGKLFGIAAGYAFQMVWAFILIFFTCYFVLTLIKKVSIWPLIVMILFSGMDIIVTLIQMEPGYVFGLQDHIEWHSIYQYSSMTTQLFWVFNQSLPAWAATAYMLTQKNCKSIVFVLALLLLNSPIPFIGIIPIALFTAFYLYPKISGIKLFKLKKFKENVTALAKGLLTFENVIGGGIIGFASYFYLSSNISSSGSLTFESIVNGMQLQSVILLLIFEVVIPVVLIRLCGIKNSLLYLSAAILLLISPFFKLGYGMDFIMRSSVPALFVLYMLTIAALIKSHRAKKHIVFYLLIAVLVIGAVTPVTEITRTVCQTVDIYSSGNSPRLPVVDYFNESGSARDNFVGPLKDNFFAQFFMKSYTAN